MSEEMITPSFEDAANRWEKAYREKKTRVTELETLLTIVLDYTSGYAREIIDQALDAKGGGDGY